MLLNQLVNGLTAGSEYALIAAGLALIFGVLEVVNFAQGAFYMVGAYFLYVIQQRLAVPYLPASLAALLGMVIFGMLFYLLIIRTILGRGWQIQLVATLAVALLLENLAIVTAGSLPHNVFSPLSAEILILGPTRFSLQRIVIIVVTLVVFAILAAYLRYTRTGKAMRALAQNREAAFVVGIPVDRVGMAAVIASSVLAGVAAVTIPPLYDVNPTMGSLLIIKAFAAVIMGGFGNVTGAIVSAFALGIIEAVATAYISSAYADVFVFGAMILVLLFRPNGLLGRAVRT